MTNTQKTEKQPPLWQITVTLDSNLTENEATTLGGGLQDLGLSLTIKREEDTRQWLALIVCEQEPMSKDITARLALMETQTGLTSNASFTVEQLPDIDWLAHVYEQFQPITVKPFYVYGSHVETEVPDNLIGIEINAANAFGTGEHPTTKGCLQAIDYLHKHHARTDHVLDLGCGSGILSIAAAKLWEDCSIIATDMDEDSTKAVNEYADINLVSDQIKTETAMGYDADLIKESPAFNVILANILAGPLIEMAQATAQHLTQGGYVVLSGMLQTQKDKVLHAHEEHGLKLVHKFPIEEWTSLILTKP